MTKSAIDKQATPQLTLALCGDIMIGRGVDQILQYSNDPRLKEPYVTSALDYVALAERANGPIPRRVAPAYVWGAALDELEKAEPDAFIINLETATTTSERFAQKSVNYRTHPENVAVLKAAGVDCCALANNHVLDFGETGLADTLGALAANGLKAAGAGATLEKARAPAIIDLAGGGRILVFAAALPSSGAPREWAAGDAKPGVHLLPDLSDKTAANLAEHIGRTKRAGDIAVVSLHWGDNWGYDISQDQRRFAHALVDSGTADLLHGHSSHHPKAAELRNQRLILYGCGDFINDYEGITGYESYRDDLVLLYLPTLSRSGAIERFEFAPFRIRRFRLNRPDEKDVDWLSARLRREYRRFGLELARIERGRFAVSL